MSSMYSLTAMTGKEASANRTVVIGTVEFNYRVWMILLWSTAPGLFIAAMLWALIGQFAIFTIPAVWGGAIFLLHRRSRTGLRLRTYQAMWDKRRANTDQFFLCGQPIEVDRTDYRTVTPNSVAYVPEAPAASHALVDVISAAPAPVGITPVALIDRPHAPAPAPAPVAPIPAALAPAAPAPDPVPVHTADPMRDPRYAAGYAAGVGAQHQPAPTPAISPVPSPVSTAAPYPTPTAPRVQHQPVPVQPVPVQPVPVQPVPVQPVPVAHPHPSRLDASLIGVEQPDPDLLDPSALLGADHETQTEKSRPRLGRVKDQS